MKLHSLARPLCVAAALLPLLLQGPSAQSIASGTTARVIVKLKADSGLMRAQAVSATVRRQSQVQSLAQGIGVDLSPGAAISDSSYVVSAIGVDADTLAARLRQLADVEYAVKDEIVRRHAVPNDPLYVTSVVNGAGSSGGPVTGQWYLKPPGAATGTAGGTAVSAINAEQAWDITTGSSSVVVAVIDTGIRFDHPDFLRVSAGGNLLDGYDFISDDNLGNDGQTGRDADASDPGDGVTTAEVNQVGGPYYHCTDPVNGNYTGENSSWHGTQTLSLVGAQTGNGIGMASVGRNVRVLPIRALGKCGRGTSSDIIAAMRWAAGLSVPGVPDNTNKATVINLSLGGSSGCSAAYMSAITEITAAGVTIVASAGNEGMAVDSPASCAGVIGVAGVRNDGDKGSVSSLGPEVSISAPIGNCPTAGQCLYPIITAFNDGAITPGNNIYTTGFAPVFTGTSFSAPLVAGAAALMLSVSPGLSPSAVKSTLMSSARAFPTSGSTVATTTCTAPTSTAQTYCYCTTTTCGAGLLDVRAAVQAVASVASQLHAAIGVSTTTPTATQVVTLNATSSAVASGHSIAAYQWALVDGGGIVTAFTSATNTATVTATPSAAGTFTVRLTVTDDAGNTSSATQSVTVAAAPVVVTPPSSGGGGGGAVGLVWLLLLLSAVLVLGWDARRVRRRD